MKYFRQQDYIAYYFEKERNIFFSFVILVLDIS